MNSYLRICAIDPSIQSTGIAILEWFVDKDEIRLVDKTTLINKGKFTDRWKKKEALLDMFSYYMGDHIEDMNFCVIENYSYHSVGYLADAGELVGLLKHYIYNHNVPFDMIAPMTVKKQVGGSGKSQKEEVALGLTKFISNLKDFDFANTDESDAAAIGVAYILGLKNESRQSDPVPDKRPGRAKKSKSK